MKKESTPGKWPSHPRPFSNEMAEFAGAKAALEKQRKALILITRAETEIDLPFARIAKMVIDRNQRVLSELYFAEHIIRLGDADELRKLIRKVQDLLTDEATEQKNESRKDAP